MGNQPAKVVKEVQKLAVDTIVSLYEIYADEIYRIHGDKLFNSDFIYWQGKAYTPVPLTATGFNKKSSGTIARPKIIVANVSGFFTGLVNENNNLVGLKIVRKRTFAKYLDGKTWSGVIDTLGSGHAVDAGEDYVTIKVAEGVGKNVYGFIGRSLVITKTDIVRTIKAIDILSNDGNGQILIKIVIDGIFLNLPDNFLAYLTGNPTADRTVEFNDEVYIINRKVAETLEFIEFELTTPLDLPEVVIPKRQIFSNHCQWVYRGTECGYTGPDVGTIEGIPLNGGMGVPDSRLPGCGQYLLSNADSRGFTRVRSYDIELTIFSLSDKFIPQIGMFVYVAKSIRTKLWEKYCPIVTKIDKLDDIIYLGKSRKQYKIYFDRELGSLLNRHDGDNLIFSGKQDSIYAKLFVPPKDRCNKRLNTGCKLRYGETGVLPFGGFPGAL